MDNALEKNTSVVKENTQAEDTILEDSVGELNGTAMKLNLYASEVVREFNSRKRQSFQVVMGETKESMASSTLNKSLKRIYISMPRKFLDMKSDVEVDALKILVGHELAHQLHARMTTPALIQVAAFVDTWGNNYKRALEEACIETAADILGAEMYRKEYGEITDEVYVAYQEILEGGQKENLLNNAAAYVKFGYLPPSFRVKLMKEFSSFSSDDYAAMKKMIQYFDFICATYLGKDPGCRRYESELVYNYRKVNFPNRINRLR